MPIKNYTTEVLAEKSISQIQDKLVAHGARAIMINYTADKEPESMSFIVPTKQGEVLFRLPANTAAVNRLLEKMKGPRFRSWDVASKERLKAQATRVAWRIIKDWVDAQLAIIETEIVTIEQVFLPYMQVKDGQTLYDAMVNRSFLLTEGKGG
jgi:hypothetical protein